MDKLSDRLVWVDMEMTGLDPVACVPIEIAVVITNGGLEEIDGASFEAVIHQPESALQDMVPIVTAMHTKNGLIDRVKTSTNTLAEVDTAVARLIAANCDAGKAVLAGNTIQQDRRFIRRYFPETDGVLHYRHVDVSSFKEMIQRWYGENAVFSKDTQHTAMEDIRSSIEELLHYRKHYFQPAEQR